MGTLTEHFELLEVEPSPPSTYRTLARTHIVPMVGKQKVGALRAAVFDSFYAELRRCRTHCNRRPFVELRTPRAHNCDHRCSPHRCRGPSRSTIRRIHVILSGALKRAVRWRWLSTNPRRARPGPTAAGGQATAAQRRRGGTQVAAGTAHREVALLAEWGMINVRRGNAVVLCVGAHEEAGHPASEAILARGTEGPPAAAGAVATPSVVDLHVRHLGADFAHFFAEADLTNGGDLRKLLVAAVRRRGGIQLKSMSTRRPSDAQRS